MKGLIFSLITAGCGLAMTLAGLTVDAYLHARDESLAAREGVFSFTNPGHALLATGIALACCGILGALYFAWGMAGGRGILGARWLRLVTVQAAGLAAAVGVLFSFAVSEAGHDHAAVAAGAHEPAALDASATPHEPPAASGTAAAASHEPAAAAATPAAHAHTAPAEATADEAACGARLVADVRAATARFEDFAVAEAEGYRTGPDGGKIIQHYGNARYSRDGLTWDLAHPETLVYVRRPDGQMRLAGALYKAPRGEHGPQPCGELTHWHTHSNCIDSATRAPAADPVGGACPDGTTLRTSVEMIHIWTAWNPAGQIATKFGRDAILPLLQ